MNTWQAPYDTGWIARSDWTNVHLGSSTTKNADSNVEHNLNAPLSKLLVKVLISTDDTDANSFELAVITWIYDGAGDVSYGIQVNQVDSNNILVQTGQYGIRVLTTSGSSKLLGSDDWYYKVKVWHMG